MTIDEWGGGEGGEGEGEGGGGEHCSNTLALLHRSSALPASYPGSPIFSTLHEKRGGAW